MSDVKNANAKTQNHKFNRLVQGLLYDMIERSSTASSESTVADYAGTGMKQSGSKASANTGKEAMWAVKLASELWRKGTWRDARTANLLSAACFHSNTKVQSVAMHFFLNSNTSSSLDESDVSSGDEDVGVSMNKIRKVKHQQQINKKKRSSDRAARKEIKKANSKRKASEIKAANGEGIDNSALNLLHDPQAFVEKLYELLARNDKRFTLEHKVLILQLYGRACGLHRAYVLSFYSYIIKYLTYSQLQITTILVALASSVHELVPPDALTPVIRKISHEFVHPGVSSQVVAAGINAVREVCRRQPWAMEPDLLEDLVDYRKSKDKGVMVASRSLLQLYREVNPDMLRKRERGKTATMNAAAGQNGTLAFGTTKDQQTSIEGLDLLEQYLSEKKTNANGDSGEQVEEEENDGWEVDSSDSGDDSGEEGWIAVSSDEGEAHGQFDDSEDEEERTDRRERKRVKFAVLPAKPSVDAPDEDEDEDTSDDDSDGESDDDGSEEHAGPAGTEAPYGAEALEVTTEEMQALQTAQPDGDATKDSLMALAMTRILTPADFAKLNELRTAAAEAEVKAGGGGAAKRKLALLTAAKKAFKSGKGDGAESSLTEGDIIGAGKKAKADYEERLASIAKGREGREKFGSMKGKKKQANPSSSTNKEKRKKTKAFAMVAQSREVRGKSKTSLRAKQRRLKGGSATVCDVAARKIDNDDSCPGYSKSQKKNASKAARL